MQKFILIRGHQGSGKSTFAEQKAAEFKAKYRDAEIVRIENDLLMTDENGVYRWSGEALDKAQKRGNALMTETLKIGRQNPNRNILIIHSNTNQKASRCRHLLDLAKKSGFETEIYRMHNFYPNLHGVKEHDVLAAYIKLNQTAWQTKSTSKPYSPPARNSWKKSSKCRLSSGNPCRLTKRSKPSSPKIICNTAAATLPPKHPSVTPNCAC